MAISYMNTTEVESIANDVISLANDFNTEINNLFKRFSDVPYVTREWVGNQAEFYFNRVSNDKKQYIDFANSLKSVGNKLNSDAYETKNCINKNYEQERY